MARTKTFEDVIAQALAPVLARFARRLERTLAAQIDSEERRRRAPARRPKARTTKRRARPAEISRWVADVRARRVPNFVIEATGLDTKKKVVARYGPGAAFEKGKPLPRPSGVDGIEAPSQGRGTHAKPGPHPVKARPPIIRKAARAVAGASA